MTTTARHVLGIDIGTNSVGSAWVDLQEATITTGLTIFPAGVEQSEDKRGEPKNAARRMVRRTRVTLARRSLRKRLLRLELIKRGLLPPTAEEFATLLASTDPWELRAKALTGTLTPHEFGRVLLHLSQRRGALGIHVDDEDSDAAKTEEGQVKQAIGATRAQLMARKLTTFGALINALRQERVHTIDSPDSRPAASRTAGNPRVYRDKVRNQRGNFEFHADRDLIRDEFDQLWTAQKQRGGPLAAMLTDEFRLLLDNPAKDDIHQHQGYLFGQRAISWDLGTLGRCDLHPSDRCAPEADMYASFFRVIDFVGTIRIIDGANPPRPLSDTERTAVVNLLRGPLDPPATESSKATAKPRKSPKPAKPADPEKPKATKVKRSFTVTDIRLALGLGKATAKSTIRLNLERDEDRDIKADWFHRAIALAGFGQAKWDALAQDLRDSINKTILKLDPAEPAHAITLAERAQKWWGCTAEQAEALVAGWKTRPKLESRLKLSRRAIRNVLALMTTPQPRVGGTEMGYLTQVEARLAIAEDASFVDVTSGQPLDEPTRRRYRTGGKGMTSRDRHYMKMHPGELPPAPMLSNPVARRSIHEVRRHILAYLRKFGRKPDRIIIELAREAKMGGVEADRLLAKNRERERIRRGIIEAFNLGSHSGNQQRIATERVLLAVQQGCRCPLCGQGGLTLVNAAKGESCEISHITPRGVGGGDGLNNLVLAHTACNRDMGRQTPRLWWGAKFEENMRWVTGIYQGRDVTAPVDQAREDNDRKLWPKYFSKRDDEAKLANFSKEVTDLAPFTDRQLADTRYATRQVMTYLADALYDGKGLPERGGERRIDAVDGGIVAQLRREWEFFFDPHGRRAKDQPEEARNASAEKDRGDHRHHAADAVIIALADASVRAKLLERRRRADGVSYDEFASFCRRPENRIVVPGLFRNVEQLRAIASDAIYGTADAPRPVAHRPVKRKLVQALHEETLFGPVVGQPGLFTGRKSVEALTGNHLRLPGGWEALATRLASETLPPEEARSIRHRLAQMGDPVPGKSGIVRDRDLRFRLRNCCHQHGFDPDELTAKQAQLLAKKGAFRHPSGVPIRAAVLLRAMSEPVLIARTTHAYATGLPTKKRSEEANRAYVGGNNHHIEIRRSAKGKWSGEVVSGFEAGRRKLAKLAAFKDADVPRPMAFANMSAAEKARWHPIVAAIEAEHPIVDRRDDEARGGEFVLSLAEGETVYMRHKETNEPGFFVVAKLDKPQVIFLVPHWDARAAGGRKNLYGEAVSESKRESISVTPSDLCRLACPGQPHAVKVLVTPLGKWRVAQRD